ncbi:hypothetical protein BDW72DRAFT_197028 [Aspergillus terricola var. indicus]
MDKHCANMIKRCNKLCTEIKNFHAKWVDKGRTKAIRDLLAYFKRKAYVQGILEQLEAAKVQILIYLQLFSLDMQDSQRHSITGLRENMEKVLSGIESLQKPSLPPPPASLLPTDTTMTVSREDTTAAPKLTDQTIDVSIERGRRAFEKMSKSMGALRETFHKSKKRKTKGYHNPPVSIPIAGGLSSNPFFSATPTGLDSFAVSTSAKNIKGLPAALTHDAKCSPASVSNDQFEHTLTSNTSIDGQHTILPKSDKLLRPQMTTTLDTSVVDKTSVLSDPIEREPETIEAPIRPGSPASSTWETCSESDSDKDRHEQVSVLDDDESHESTQPLEEGNKISIDNDSNDADDEHYDQEQPLIWKFSDEALLLFPQLSKGSDDDIPVFMDEDVLVDISMLSAMHARPDGVLQYFQARSARADAGRLLSRLQNELGIDGLQCAICISWALGLEDEFRYLTGIAQKAATTALELLPTPISDMVEARRIDALDNFDDALTSLLEDYVRTNVRSCPHFNFAVCSECHEWDKLERSFNLGFLLRHCYYWGWIRLDKSDGEADQYRNNTSFNNLRHRVQSIRDLKSIFMKFPAERSIAQQLLMIGFPTIGRVVLPQTLEKQLTNRSKEGLNELLNELDEGDWGLELSDFQGLSVEKDVLHRIQLRLLDMFPDRRRE